MASHKIARQGIKHAEKVGKTDEAKTCAYYNFMSDRGFDEVEAYHLYQIVF